MLPEIVIAAANRKADGYIRGGFFTRKARKSSSAIAA
jgi:hypothetical protein